MVKSIRLTSWVAALSLTAGITMPNANAGGPALPVILGAVGGILADRATGPSTNVGLDDYAVLPATQGGYQAGCQPLQMKYSTDISQFAVNKDDIYAATLKRIKLGSDADKDISFSDRVAGHIQLAAVAKGFEMSASATTANGFDFSPSSAESGRVVYYSDDVKPGQSLNFGQLVMFGPSKYQGNPVGVSLFVFKIANGGNNKMSPLLSSLATLGKSVANPDVIGVLETLGTQLLQGQDERVFRYDTMLLAKNSEAPSMNTANLVYGDYVLIRQEDRSKPIDWGQYRYDPTTAKLYEASSCIAAPENKGQVEPKEVEAVSYAVMQIVPANQAAYQKATDYAVLKKAISDAVATNNPSVAAAAVDGPINTFVQSKMLQQALDTIEAASKASPDNKTKRELPKTLDGIKQAIAAKAIDPRRQFNPESIDRLILAINDAGITVTKDKFDYTTVLNAFKAIWTQPKK